MMYKKLKPEEKKLYCKYKYDLVASTNIILKKVEVMYLIKCLENIEDNINDGMKVFQITSNLNKALREILHRGK